MSYMRGTPEQRFWNKVNVNGPVPKDRPELGPCYLWLGATSDDGHGVFGEYSGAPTVRAHRYAYELEHDTPPPAGKQPLHVCGHKLCINIAHIEWVSRAVAMKVAYDRKPWDTTNLRWK